MASFLIRTIEPSDLPQLMALDHSSTSEAVWQLELQRDPRESRILASFREVRLPRPVALAYPIDPFSLADEWVNKAMMFTAVAGKDPVGYIALTQRSGAVSWITDVVVAPRWRRQGVATMLLGSAHEWSQSRHHRRVFLEMQSKNQPAIKLAQKLGYEFCGYNDHYYLTQDIALFFVRAF
jgi:ribosomal protein S18 acetylase RimI-like enzyme